MVTTMTEVTPKGVAAPFHGSTSRGEETAKSESTSRYIGVFIRCGRIEKIDEGLAISYESFGKRMEVLLPTRSAQILLNDRGAPGQDLVRTWTGINGAEVPHQIGKAYRSRSGKALMIKTIDSQGDLSVPWQAFKKVFSGESPNAPVSRIDQPESSQQRPPSDLSQGLERGF